MLTEKLKREQNNMDGVRYYLALSVVVAHFNHVFGTDLWWATSSHAAVGGFFALSGFLIFGSYQRSKSLGSYLARRGRRILPSYFLVVLISALALVGISSLSASEYYASANFWKYLGANLTFMNFLHPTLPGVFESNTDAAVNGSLWTMKIEWMLYLSVPVMCWVLGKWKVSRTKLLIATVLFSMLYSLLFTYIYYEISSSTIFEILSRQVFAQLMYFYAGVLIWFHFERYMRWRWWLAGVALMMWAVADYLPYYQCWAAPIVTTSLVFFASFTGQWGRWIARAEDVSYDMYLYHYPILQTAAVLLVSNASLATQPKANQVVTLVALVLIIYAVSYLSWTLLGKRCIRKVRSAHP